MTGNETKALMPVAMTVAGSDSGGGAGIQADLRTFAFFRVFGTSAITAATSQNPLTVSGIAPIPPEDVALQIRTVFAALEVKALKTGMLFSAPVVRVVRDALDAFAGGIVTDPVMVSTSGKMLVEKDAAEAMTNLMFPIASWITPNIPETEVITGMRIDSLDAMLEAARRCSGKWGCGTIVKGGHFGSGDAVDAVCHEDKVYLLSSKRCAAGGHADHGTGCTFSAAFAALLAKGIRWEEALPLAKAFVFASLSEAVRLSGDGVFGMFPPEEPLAHYSGMISFRAVEQ